MARAKRHYLPGYIWHITHRCHKKEFHLKFSRDKNRWLQRSRIGVGPRQPSEIKKHYYAKQVCSFVIALFISFQLVCDPAQAADEIVNVGVYENAPKIFISESGQPAGIFIDIIESIAKSEGWQLNYVPGTWGEGLDRLERGEIDGLWIVGLGSGQGNLLKSKNIIIKIRSY